MISKIPQADGVLDFRRTQKRAPEEHKIEFMREVGKILPTAVTLAQETRDPELQALIKKVEETL